MATTAAATTTISSSAAVSPPGHERHYEIALIGVGHRGYKTHFLNTVGSRSESIIAVCDANDATLAAFSAKHPDIPAYRSLVDLLRYHRPDFVIVCTPHKFHVDCILLLSKAGIPVLKEKPAANSLEEFGQLTSLPIKIGVTFQKRFEPRFVQFEKLLSEVGKIASFRATLMVNIKDLESTWRAADNVGVTVRRT
jgi:predicted dehydrogenase